MDLRLAVTFGGNGHKVNVRKGHTPFQRMLCASMAYGRMPPYAGMCWLMLREDVERHIWPPKPFTNALPFAKNAHEQRLERQLLGHDRGRDVHDRTYHHDAAPADALPFLSTLKVTLPAIARFDIDAGLRAIQDALARKDGGHGL